jgi:hypothetical protein
MIQENIMKEFLKSLIRKTPLYNPLRTWLRRRRQKIELRDWERNGRPVPPPHIIKQGALRKYAEQYNLKIFV